MRRPSIIAVLFGALSIAGCARTVVENPLSTDYDRADQEQELAFWHALPERSAVTNDEGLHGLFLLADGADPSASYAERVALARTRGWVGESFDEDANLAMQRGTLARCLATICSVKGGVMMHLLGPTPRYALREMIDKGVMSASTANQTISGGEYLASVSKAQDYITIRALKAEKKAAGDEPAPAAPAPALID